MKFAALLALLVALPITAAVGFLIGESLRTEAPPQPHWIYSPRQKFSTAQTGVVVYCQGKTNSLPFAQRKRATPGAVQIVTCRAVKAP
jgi:hypothetical protein